MSVAQGNIPVELDFFFRDSQEICNGIRSTLMSLSLGLDDGLLGYFIIFVPRVRIDCSLSGAAGMGGGGEDPVMTAKEAASNVIPLEGEAGRDFSSPGE